MKKKAGGGLISSPKSGLGSLGKMKSARMPSTGMKYSTYRLNPGSQLNRSIHLPRFKVKKFAEGGHIDSRIEGTPPIRSKSAKEENIDYLNRRDRSSEGFGSRLSSRDLAILSGTDPNKEIPKLNAGGKVNLPMTGNVQSIPGGANRGVQEASKVLAALQMQRGRPLAIPPAGSMPQVGVQPVDTSRKAGFADGGKVGLTASAMRVISDALSHLADSDRASAIETLKGSKEASAHPDVAEAAQAMRSSAGAKTAAKKLGKVLEGKANEETEATFANGGAVTRCRHCGGLV